MLLPHLSGVEVERVEHVNGVVRVVAKMPAVQVACPACGTLSGQVHSRYQRRLADTPISGQPMVIVLEVRRLVPAAHMRAEDLHRASARLDDAVRA